MPNIPSVDLSSSVSAHSDDIIVATFQGGTLPDAGHHQDRYTEFVATTEDARLDAFFADVAHSGYAGNGLAWAVDVTVPENMR